MPWTLDSIDVDRWLKRKRRRTTRVVSATRAAERQASQFGLTRPLENLVVEGLIANVRSGEGSDGRLVRISDDLVARVDACRSPSRGARLQTGRGGAPDAAAQPRDGRGTDVTDPTLAEDVYLARPIAINAGECGSCDYASCITNATHLLPGVAVCDRCWRNRVLWLDPQTYRIYFEDLSTTASDGSHAGVTTALGSSPPANAATFSHEPQHRRRSNVWSRSQQTKERNRSRSS